MANRNVKCETTINFSSRLDQAYVPRSSVIELKPCAGGTTSVDATDIARVGRGKNNWAWVVLKSTGERVELNESYEAVVKKWKAALP